MWQEILAVDSRVSRLRSSSSGSDHSMYLKRRLQLLQGMRGAANHGGGCADEEMDDPDIVDREAGGG